MLINNTIDYFSHEHISKDVHQYKGVFHAHLGIELLIIQQGKGTIIVNQEHYDIKPGMVCLFQPYQLHRVIAELDDEHPFIRSVVTFEPVIYARFFEQWPSLNAFFMQLYNGIALPPQYFTQEEIDLLLFILSNYSELIKQASQQTYLEIYSLFLVALLQQFKRLLEGRHINFNNHHVTRRTHQAERIMQWLEVHYMETLSLEKMSKDLHLSVFHLSHAFKKHTGMTISDYLNSKRMQQSVILLQSSNYPIARIAEEVGYSSPSYFCKIFKGYFGVSPNRYKQTFLT